MISDFDFWEVHVNEKDQVESVVLKYTSQSMPSTSQIGALFNLKYLKTVLISNLDFQGVGRFQ